MTKELRMVEDNESTLTTNVVSTFLMGFLLMPELMETAERFGTTPYMTAVSSDLYVVANSPSAKLLMFSKPGTTKKRRVCLIGKETNQLFILCL